MIQNEYGASSNIHGTIADNVPTENTTAISAGRSLAPGKENITADAKSRHARANKTAKPHEEEVEAD